jgi:hypothetical protein
MSMLPFLFITKNTYMPLVALGDQVSYFPIGIEIGEGGPDPTDFEFFCNHAAHEVLCIFCSSLSIFFAVLADCNYIHFQGTSMLSHYRVIHDDNNFTVDQIKYICNNLFTP